jgi:hypothetical protein
MPFCPKCRIEYIDGTDKCDVCGGALTDTLPDEAPDGAARDDTPAFLISVDSAVEAEMLNARLSSAHIPCYVRPHDSSGVLRVYMGGDNLGSDFYVPSGLLEAARAAADIPGPADGASAQAPHAVSGKKDRKGTVLAIIGIIVVRAAVFARDALLGYIRSAFGYN